MVDYKSYDGNCSPRNPQFIQPNGGTYHLLPGLYPTTLRCKFNWRGQTSAHLSQYHWSCYLCNFTKSICSYTPTQVLFHWLTFLNVSRSIMSPREVPLWSATTYTKEINSKERRQRSMMQLFANSQFTDYLEEALRDRFVCGLRDRAVFTTIALGEGTHTRKSYGSSCFNGGS